MLVCPLRPESSVTYFPLLATGAGDPVAFLGSLSRHTTKLSGPRPAPQDAISGWQLGWAWLEFASQRGGKSQKRPVCLPHWKQLSIPQSGPQAPARIRFNS